MPETIGIELVPLPDIDVDHRYQRKISHKAEQMAKVFDEKLANVVILSRRKDGSLFVVDGQHRVKAARMAKRTHQLAAVYEGLSLRDEARMFDQVNNNRKPMRALDRFDARLLYGDPVAKAIHQAVFDLDGLGPKNMPPNHFQAVGAAERVYLRQGEDVLKESLRILWESYGTLKSGVAFGNLLIALSYIVADKQVKSQDIIDALRHMPGGHEALRKEAYAQQMREAHLSNVVALRQIITRHARRREQARQHGVQVPERDDQNGQRDKAYHEQASQLDREFEKATSKEDREAITTARAALDREYAGRT